MLFFLAWIRVCWWCGCRAAALDKNRSEQASREDAVHSAHIWVFIDGALSYRLDFTRSAERHRLLHAPFDLQLDRQEMLKFSTDKSDCPQVEGTIFQHCWSIFLPRCFYAKNNIDVLIFYVSTSNIHRGANEWLPMHLLLACIPGGPINWKGWILAFWLYCFLGCRVFLDVSAWNLLLLHQCFEPIPFSFSFVVVTSIVVDVVDIVVVVAYAVISQQTRIFFPLCLCCRTSFQLLNKVAITLGGSKSCIYFSLRM